MTPTRRRGLGWRRPVVASADPLADAPIRRWARWAFIGDTVAAVVAGIVARLVRFGFEDAVLADSSVRIPYAALGFGMAAMWPLATALAGAYGYRVALFGVEELRRLLRAGVGLLAGVGVLHFVLSLDLARGFVGLFIPLAVLLSAIWRLVLRARTGRDQRRGLERHRAVLVGPVEEVHRTRMALATGASTPIEVIAYVADGLAPGETPITLADLPRLESREAVGQLRDSGVAFDLLLRAGRPEQREMWALARIAHEHRLGLAIAPDRRDNNNVAWTYVPLGSTPLLLVETPSLTPTHRIAKGIFDRVVAGVLLVALSPVLATLVALILLRDGRPVFFRQERVGRDGAPFEMWKFRSMVRDAEHHLADLTDANIADGPRFKLHEDPRVTPLGRWMRRHSLDELPQLLNVLAGNMSLVGPRPPLPYEVEEYDEREARRLLVKPGMTGLWQVQGRSDLPWDEAVYLDVMYIDHWSPLLDLVIIARTFKTVLRPAGAY